MGAWHKRRLEQILFALGLLAIHSALCAAFASAQTDAEMVRIAWEIDDAPANGWTVGDRIRLWLRATHPSGLAVTLPALPDAWGPFELREQRLLQPVENQDGTVSVVREATVTLWTPGDHQTPPLAVRYRDGKDQLHEVQVPPLSITVVSVLEDGDTEKRDLKPQVTLARPPLWPWVLGGLLVVLLLGVVGWIFVTSRRRRTSPAFAQVQPYNPRPPHEVAYAELARISALKLPSRGELKTHYTLVADCMRTYVEDRYQIPAMDQTTDELISFFRAAHMDREYSNLFRELLAEADLVKFAKFQPPDGQPCATLAQARHIVDVTRSEEVENEDSETQRRAGSLTNHQSQTQNHA